MSTCLHCGNEYISGDADYGRCQECLAKGHTVGIGRCRVCEAEERHDIYWDRLRDAGYSEEEIDRILRVLLDPMYKRDDPLGFGIDLP